LFAVPVQTTLLELSNIEVYNHAVLPSYIAEVLQMAGLYPRNERAAFDKYHFKGLYVKFYTVN
jgi:hypothetical protein